VRPDVSDADALDDGAWFDLHPKRRFRARRGPDGFWLIRKRGDAFLRAYTRSAVPGTDTDAGLAPAWFESAYPDLLAAKARGRARKARGGRHERQV
jgi:hypothetical protein